jgi:hypothetical protein
MLPIEKLNEGVSQGCCSYTNWHLALTGFLVEVEPGSGKLDNLHYSLIPRGFKAVLIASVY